MKYVVIIFYTSQVNIIRIQWIGKVEFALIYSNKNNKQQIQVQRSFYK